MARKPTKLRGVRGSKRAEAKYRRDLLKIVNGESKKISLALTPFFKMLVEGRSTASDLTQIFNKLKIDILQPSDKISKIAEDFVTSVDKVNARKIFNGAKMAPETSKVAGVSLKNVVAKTNMEDLLKLKTAENVRLIKSIPEEHLNKIEQLVFEGVINKDPVGGMQKAIREIGGVTRSRAKLIARDQTSKLNGSLNKARQESMDIEEYTWRTAKDGRTRATHKANNGKVFRWDTPPATGHPGEDVNCRCVPEAIVDFD